MSGRREEDRRKVKRSHLLAGLAIALGFLATVVSYKAIVALDKFDRAMSAVLESQGPKKGFSPEGF